MHIRRDPYTVFLSTRHLNEVLTRAMQFQRPDSSDLDAAVIRRYKIMYDAYFEERGLIPESRLCELAFEDLEHDPIGQIRQVYETLDLPGFGTVLPHLEEYVGTLSGYKKNEYPNPSPALRVQIQEAWRRSFEEWDYPLD